MKENHPNIILVFVPGGCTSVWQPLDVGIQRVLKLSMRRSAHRDIVHEVSSQIEEGVEHIALDTTLRTLRNCSLQWVLNAIADVDNQQLILKVSLLYSACVSLTNNPVVLQNVPCWP